MRLRRWVLVVAVAALCLGNVVVAAKPPVGLLRTVGIAWAKTTHPEAPRQMTRWVDGLPVEQLALQGPKPVAPPPAPGEGLAAFEGLSTWIDTYDTELTAQQQVEIAAAHGVDTLFVQVSRVSTEGLLHDHARLSETIERAHDHGMRVMVWTIPTFTDLGEDAARAKAAMAFVTPRGDRPDAFGLDIEVDRLPDVGERSRRLLLLSERLRWWAGPDYPMAAIVLPPRQLERNTTWWPGFPYQALDAHFDVFVPMSYSSYRGTDATTTYNYNHDNVIRTRELVGRADLPVHLAGGIADDLPEVVQFVRAAADTGAIGAGLYDLHTTPTEAWGPLGVLSQRRAAVDG